MLGGDGVGGIGETRCAFVRSYHEVRIVGVVDHDAFGMHDRVAHDVVGDRQQRANVELVALAPFRGPGFAVLGWVGQAFWIEAALGARRHDDGVLYALRLHQPEHFCAEIVTPVRPADAAARDRAGAQVDALDAARIDEDFAPRHGLGKARHLRGIELEGQCIRAGGGESVGPQDRGEDTPVKA